MGEIIESKVIEGKVLYKVVVDEKELLSLKGGMRNVHLFSLDLCDTESKIVERGKRGVTKHFLIPIKHRHKTKKRPNSISYHIINMDTKSIFIYTVDK